MNLSQTLLAGGRLGNSLTRKRLSCRFTLPDAALKSIITEAASPSARPISSPLAAQRPQLPLITLERAVQTRLGVDRELWESCSFSAEVYPDLPVAGSWAELAARLFSRQSSVRSPAGTKGTESSGRLLIQTIGCQIKSRGHLKRQLRQAATDNASAVLIVSGSHPAHGIASTLGWTPNSLELLKTASQMQRDGRLQADLGLWAVENPLRNPASRLEQKLDAGAQVVLTQPPLLWSRFANWWGDAHRAGLTKQAAIVVGVPMLTSVANVRFWLSLCNAMGEEGAAQLVQDFSDHAADAAELVRYTQQYNQRLVEQVLQLPGIAGLHIMPLTKSARQQVLELQRGGTIPSCGI